MFIQDTGNHLSIPTVLRCHILSIKTAGSSETTYESERYHNTEDHSLKMSPRWCNGRKVSGFKPGLGDVFLMAIKIRSTSSFGREVKPSASCRKILQHVKELLTF
jgi:hypothetical protein